MDEQQALVKMISPAMQRPGKPRGGVIQIWLTRACNLACFNCTQGSNYGGKPGMMTPDQFEIACKSLKHYFGVVGLFGGNPAMHPKFPEICEIARKYFPKKQLGLWCNDPRGHGKVMRETFNPAVSNLNVHLVQSAYDEFKRDWPESRPFGLHDDSRHSPVYVAMKDVLKKSCPDCHGNMGHFVMPNGDLYLSDEPGSVWKSCETCEGSGQVYDEQQAWELISNCDINKHWSAMVGVFRGEVRGWFCEIAGAQAMLQQHNPDYPDTGILVDNDGISKDPNGHNQYWWRLGMNAFSHQVRKHCHECSVPLRGHGALAVSDPNATEQISGTYSDLKPKKKDRPVQLVTLTDQLGRPLDKTTTYLQNAKK